MRRSTALNLSRCHMLPTRMPDQAIDHHSSKNKRYLIVAFFIMRHVDPSRSMYDTTRTFSSLLAGREMKSVKHFLHSFGTSGRVPEGCKFPGGDDVSEGTASPDSRPDILTSVKKECVQRWADTPREAALNPVRCGTRGFEAAVAQRDPSYTSSDVAREHQVCETFDILFSIVSNVR